MDPTGIEPASPRCKRGAKPVSATSPEYLRIKLAKVFSVLQRTVRCAARFKCLQLPLDT